LKKEELFFTSTTSPMPVKAILDEGLYNSLKKERQILPRHLQLSVTNACNSNCSFCSFKNRDKSIELSLESVKDIIDTFITLETQAVTLTGGGEPLCHPNINEILLYCKQKLVKVGLITNGLLLEKLSDESLASLTWCRISFDDNKDINDVEKIASVLRNVCSRAPSVYWSFSYVVLKNQNTEIQRRIVSLAESLNMRNVRFCPDQNNVEDIRLDLTFKNNSIENKNICIYDKKVAGDVYPECWLYLLKPFIASDGFIYPCCCSQYSSNKNDFAEIDNICYYKDFEKKLYSMQAFHPTCDKCFFSHYNEYINAILNNIVHGEWI